MKETGIVIRKAKLGDEKGKAEMIKEGITRKNWIYNGSNKAPNKEKIRKMKEKYKKNSDEFIFVAIDKKNKKVIGSVSGSFKKSGRVRHRVSFGWGVHPDYQGRGIATALLKTALNFAKKKKFKKATAEAAIENTASLKLAKKAGFKIEGRLEKGLLTDDGRYIDTYIFGRLL